MRTNEGCGSECNCGGTCKNSKEGNANSRISEWEKGAETKKNILPNESQIHGTTQCIYQTPLEIVECLLEEALKVTLKSTNDWIDQKKNLRFQEFPSRCFGCILLFI